ncbi:tetratricopeptide repeat-containing sulfotransferase family protein [Pseudoxanthomonas composti]|uniref:Uncharacterized protein n=1 Tax=Pseudoxanthomonas composti TaxID=2137479 RepID=A0A4Q1K081_9GAMM|nr:sulfotransferase [Pseudoxanthomonas composti]RXR08421.1 hypothetical protein EPA99_00905 [Pseudoxanthomonas composti]
MTDRQAIARQLDQLWSQAQDLEKAGAVDAAIERYAQIVSVDAHHVPALLRLSRFTQFQGRYRQSRQYARDAADAVRLGQRTRLMSYVTQRLLEFSEELEVSSLILSTDWQDPDVVRQSPVLAQHLWLAGRYEDSLRFIDTLTPRIPPHPLMALTRANVLRYLGRMDEASAAYEHALQLAPDLPDTHWAIATHARAPTPGARVPRVRAAVGKSSPGSIEHAHLCFALFRELQDAGELDPAWDALRAGLDSMTRIIPKASDTTEEALDQSARIDWKISLNQRALQPLPSPIPIFVVGLPRTGTTLLERIVGNHGWVSSVGERNDFGAAVSEVADQFFTTLLQAQNPGTLVDIDHRAVGHLYLQRLRRHASATAFALDKNPQNLFNIPLILRALPQARILILKRAPMDAAFSNLKELFQGGAYAYSYDFSSLAAHVRAAYRWADAWAARAPQSIRIVQYEELVAAPEPVTASLLEFIGLPPAPGLTDMRGNTSPVATASSAQVRRPINTEAIEAWRRYEAPLQPLLQLMGSAS